jgi:hypothetical protein
MIGGYFKFHWVDPQHIVYKIDDPTSPLTAMSKVGSRLTMRHGFAKSEGRRPLRFSGRSTFGGRRKRFVGAFHIDRGHLCAHKPEIR